MRHVKSLNLNEDVFNVKSLDYVDSFYSTFRIFSYLKQKGLIDRDGELIANLNEINERVEKYIGIDEPFNSIDDYYDQLSVVIDIIKNYRNKL